WLIAPAGEVRAVHRRYRPGTLILETDFETANGKVTLVDTMTAHDDGHNLVRLVQGREGQVALHTELIIRFDYGSIVPWVRSIEDGISAIGGPDRLLLRTAIPLRGENLTTVADFTVAAGQQVAFTLSWHPSYTVEPAAFDADAEVRRTE